LEHFFNLRAEKQEHIINAALTVFGRSGYKKAAIADIAAEAGIAKGMVIYYFGSKNNLYIYLAKMCAEELTEEMTRLFDPAVTDFFDRMKMLTHIKIAAMKRHSANNAFLSSFYLETDSEVYEDVQAFISEGLKTRKKWIIEEADTSRLKEDIDPKILDRFLIWAAEGFASNAQKAKSMEEMDAFIHDLFACLDMMKKYFYKD